MIKDNKSLPQVAYFCMEYGLASDFKTYAGGLGILAGDYLKGAKDMNMPIIGIGIKWKQGYGEQMIDQSGAPFDAYHNHSYEFLKDTGVKIPVTIRDVEVICKVWLCDNFGNNPLYLLDTDLPENSDAWITAQLYGGFSEDRIAQEMVLGIGGIRALRALNIPIDVYHFNEGHAVFAGLELIREKMCSGFSFEESWKQTRTKVVFTTHTPIIQGNESHPIKRLKYMGAFNGLSKEQMLRLGGDPFSMTIAALRLSKKSNAVAMLHGKTSNGMWNFVPGKSEIISITNGMHTPTWVDTRITEAYKNNNDLIPIHNEIKKELIEFIQLRNNVTLDPNKLLIGFARRAAPYKRSDLIFSKLDIIDPYFKSGEIQIVFSGKAHPLDDTGKKIVSNLIAMSRKYPNSVVFLENYDMEIGKMLTRGCDIWLNNPKRPEEASGTSGMKAAMNGVLNCSILDGWWPEACIDGVNGWQFGHGLNYKEGSNKKDAAELYDTLINKIIPTYYLNKPKWETMMKKSIETCSETFNISRMIKEYYEKLYRVD